MNSFDTFVEQNDDNDLQFADFILLIVAYLALASIIILFSN